jgi:hypothetical protein
MKTHSLLYPNSSLREIAFCSNQLERELSLENNFETKVYRNNPKFINTINYGLFERKFI